MPAGTKLGAKWQLDAALLSRPVDLTALVSLSQTNPDEFFNDDTLSRMVKMLLNATDDTRSDKDTRLDVLTVLSNLAALPELERREQIKMALDGVNEWFDDYMAQEEARISDGLGDLEVEPELHKLMLLLLSRLYDYKLKTDDLLELVRADKILGLETVVGLLEDGETYTTELHRKQAPSMGRMGQWEHKLVCHRHEKPLVLQLCRLLRGFTLPASYFSTEADGRELTEHSVNDFTHEMDLLLDITIKSRLVEKLALACHECLFAAPDEERDFQLDDSDHRSIACVHSFLQNLYFYATRRSEDYRQHLLADTLLIPRLILPYLDRSVQRAAELNARAEAYQKALAMGNEEDSGSSDEAERRRCKREAAARRDAGGVLECPPLVQGISASLRTLVVASFRAPPTRFMLELLRRLNPTESLLRASAFCARHEYIFSLLCLLNVNMGALDLANESSGPSPSAVDYSADGKEEEGEEEGYQSALQQQRATQAHALLHTLARVYRQMEPAAQQRVVQTVTGSGALPVARDCPSFAAVMSVLLGGSADGQSDYGGSSSSQRALDADDCDEAHRVESAAYAQARSQAKREAKQRAESFDAKGSSSSPGDTAVAQAKGQDDDLAGGSLRLLGELPSLGKKPQNDAQLRLHLALPSKSTTTTTTTTTTNASSNGEVKQQQPWMSGAAHAHRQAPPREHDFPKEFACAINGHLLKEPMRSPHGHVFEKSTIELWLDTRGSVCPITGKPLSIDQLVKDTDVRSRLMLWHIQRMKDTMKTSVSAMHGDEDDLYDF